MNPHLLIPTVVILLASCSPSVNSPDTSVAGTPENTVTSPSQTAPPASNSGATGANAIRTVRGAREAASTVNTFRSLFGAF